MKAYRKDLGNAELEVLMRPEIESLMQQVVPRQQHNPEPVREESKEQREPISDLQGSHKVTVEEKEYLESIYQHPFLTITGRAERLGLSAYMNNKMKNALTQKELITEFSANLGHATRGNVKFQRLTTSGYEAIGKKAPQKRKHTCSDEHWIFQESSHAWYSNKGYQCEIEMNLNGKRADLGIKKDGKVIALEFELTPKNAVQNAIKDIDAGFEKVIIACKNTKVKQTVQQKLEQALSEQQWKRVQVMLLSEFNFVKDIFKSTKQ